MRSVLRLAVCIATVTATATLASCASANGPMQRALDPSMEQVLAMDNYIHAVAGISGDASRFVRGDGFVYLADIAPSLGQFARTGDSASYRRLRRYVGTSVIERDATGAQPRRRVRGRTPFERAAPYTVRRLGDALALGWQQFGDTASAELAASLRFSESAGDSGSVVDQLVERCSAAVSSAGTDPATARRILAGAKSFRGGVSAGQASSLDLRGADGDLVALACLTRLALAAKDPDATVRFLDRMLDEMKPFLSGSRRPDPGAAAEVLLALSEVRATGPRYFGAR